MPKIILTRGIPASGKTTAAKKWVAEDSEHRSRVNRDDLRQMMFPGGPGVLGYEREKLVTKAQHDAIRHLLNEGFDVIVDDTNLKSAFVKEFYRLCEDVEFWDFPISVEEAIANDQRRADAGGRQVGADVIKMLYDKFTPKGKFPKIPERPDTADQVFPKVEWLPGLRDAIIVDIDGTLANHHGVRHPHDTSKYLEDRVHDDIRHLVWVLGDTGYTIIVTSGRDEQFRPELEQWLESYGIRVDEIHMRTKGDKRSDDIVKNEIFENNIHGRFNVDFVLDDRQRVVDMWRAKGLRCLQVQAGDF